MSVIHCKSHLHTRYIATYISTCSMAQFSLATTTVKDHQNWWKSLACSSVMYFKKNPFLLSRVTTNVERIMGSWYNWILGLRYKSECQVYASETSLRWVLSVLGISSLRICRQTGRSSNKSNKHIRDWKGMIHEDSLNKLNMHNLAKQWLMSDEDLITI